MRKVGTNKNVVQQGTDRVSPEGQLLDQKSLRAVTGKTTKWNEIAKDCIAFANATGGRMLLGIEDGQDARPAGQQIPRSRVRRAVAHVTACSDLAQNLVYLSGLRQAEKIIS